MKLLGVVVLACAACGGGTGTGADGGTDGPAPSDAAPDGNDGGHPNTIALVDDDGFVGDGSGKDAPVLAAYQGWLAAAGLTAFDTITVAYDGSQSSGASAVPSAARLAQYDAVIWFAAFNANGTGAPPLSGDQEAILGAWLDSGGKKLVLFSENLIEVNTGGTVANWVAAPTDALFAKYLPAQQVNSDAFVDQGADGGCPHLDSTNVPIDGTSAVSSAFAGMSWTFAATSTLPQYNVSLLIPASGVDTLATVQAIAPGVNCGNGDQTYAVAVGSKSAGGTSSTVVYVGVEPYNMVSGAQEFVSGILRTYAGLP